VDFEGNRRHGSRLAPHRRSGWRLSASPTTLWRGRRQANATETWV
jgi:hypothetical protein